MTFPFNNKIINLIVISITILTSISYVDANNSQSSRLDGFGGIVTLLSIGFIAFMAPRLRKDSLEDSK